MRFSQMLTNARAWSGRQAARIGAGASHFPWKATGAWIGGVFCVLALTLVLFLTFADWNLMKGAISRFASTASGREIVIGGDLDVDPWSLTPEVRVTRLSVGNTAQFRERPMFAQINEARAAVRLLPLFVGRIDVVKLDVRGADLELYRRADGVSNWSPQESARERPFNLPAIRRFSLSDGAVHLVDEKREMDLDATFTTEESADASDPGRFALKGEGQLNKRRFVVDITGNPLLNVRRDRPYPFKADVQMGATRVKLEGSIRRPFDLAAFDANVTASGTDLSDLYYLTGLTLPNTPPYSLRGRLDRSGDRYAMRQITGRVGDSDLAGGFEATRRNGRLFLDGAFTSRRLDFDDLVAVLGGAPDTDETASAEQRQVAANMEAQGRILPDAKLDISRVRNMDARVSYKAARVRSENLPLRGLDVEVALERGLLRLDPLTLTLAPGRLGGAVSINAREATPRVDLDMRLTDARLETIFPMKGEPALTGALHGRARLSGSGFAAREAAANANGRVSLLAPSGEVREAFAELTGINVTRGLGLLLSEDQGKIGIRCGVASFDVRNGVAHARSLVVDTETMLIGGEGEVSLRDETLNLRLQGEPKEPRLIRIAAPIRVGGRLRSPSIGVDAGGAAVQGGLAALLASMLAPIAAVLPFVDPGLAEDADCTQVMSGRPQAQEATERRGDDEERREKSDRT